MVWMRLSCQDVDSLLGLGYSAHWTSSLQSMRRFLVRPPGNGPLPHEPGSQVPSASNGQRSRTEPSLSMLIPGQPITGPNRIGQQPGGCQSPKTEE